MSTGQVTSWLSLAGRIGVALLLGLALWNPNWHSSPSPMNTVIVLDESQSMGVNRAASAWKVTTSVLADLPPGARYSLLRFGTEPVLEIANRPTVELAGLPALPRKLALDSTGTNIEVALRLAARQFDRSIPTRLILATDGGETIGDATGLLTSFRAMGLPAPLLLLDIPEVSGPDVAISVVDLPSHVPLGAKLMVVLNIVSTRDGPVRAQVQQTSKSATSVSVDLVKDQVSRIRVPLEFDTPGSQELGILVTMPGDINPANNRHRAIVNVEGPATIFYVTGKSGTTVSGSLLAGGWNLILVQPEHFPQIQHLLSSHTTVVLDDVSIGDMPEPMWVALTESVRTRGTGLLVLGGQRSFGAGGYLNSTLETALPVTSEAGAPMSRAAVLFVVDKSGSMGRGPGDITSFDLAKTAVLTATMLLGEHDHSGVIAFDIDPHTWLPLEDHDDPMAAVMDSWKDIPSGGTRIAPALMTASRLLGDVEVDQRLLILVTDGFAVEDDYSAVLAKLDEYEIDVIALAIGDEPAIDTLEKLTSRNDGQLLRVSDEALLPRLAGEAVGSRRLTYDSSVTQPRQELQVPFLDDNDQPWPKLNGYMVTKERSNARVYLRSERGDPLLADHDFGLGRVVVLPAGLGAYASSWPDWPAWAPFIGGVAEWAGNRFGGGRIYTRISQEYGRPQIEIDVLSTGGDWETSDMTRVSLSDPFGRITVLKAQAVAPGKYRAELPLQQTGRHRVSVRMGDISRHHDFFHEAPAEMGAGTQADQTLAGWMEQELVQPWNAKESDKNLLTVTAYSTRSLFILLAALLYLGTLVLRYVDIFHNWCKRITGERELRMFRRQ